MPERLSAQQIEQQLLQVPEWAQADDGIQRSFEFRDFIEAWGFMAQVALLAQAMDHHPEWSNVYRKVDIRLSTHDVGGLSALDFELARRIDALACTRTD